MDQTESSLPITDPITLRKLENELLSNGYCGARNLTVWIVSMRACLPIQNVVSLKYHDVYSDDGSLKTYVNAGRFGEVYLVPCWRALKKYLTWLNDHHVSSKWLFPSFPNVLAPLNKHMTVSRYYLVLNKAGKKVGLNRLGNESARRTGALRILHSTHNIGLVMQVLHKRDLVNTKKFLGLSDYCNHAFVAHSLRVAFK